MAPQPFYKICGAHFLRRHDLFTRHIEPLCLYSQAFMSVNRASVVQLELELNEISLLVNSHRIVGSSSFSPRMENNKRKMEKACVHCPGFSAHQSSHNRYLVNSIFMALENECRHTLINHDMNYVYPVSR